MDNYDSNSAASAVGVLAFLGVMFIPLMILGVITLIGQWKIYTKAGKPGWACIIPIYNLIVMLEIVGKPVWWIFLFFIPCVNFVFLIWTLNLLSKSFGQSEGFTLGLLFLGFIFFPILGFGNYPYLGPAASEARGYRPNAPFSPDNPFKSPNQDNPFKPNTPDDPSNPPQV